MQAKPVELHPGAEEDYLQALAWYRDRKFSAAVKFDDAFWQAIRGIEDAAPKALRHPKDCRRAKTGPIESRAPAPHLGTHGNLDGIQHARNHRSSQPHSCNLECAVARPA